MFVCTLAAATTQHHRREEGLKGGGNGMQKEKKNDVTQHQSLRNTHFVRLEEKKNRESVASASESIQRFLSCSPSL